MSKVFLIDGSSIFFRSFHAIRDLRRSDGFPTNALYGYVMTLRSLMKEYGAEEMAVAFDRSEPTFREERYPLYKANRDAPPEELRAQVPLIKQVTGLMGLRGVEAPGYEADDLLAAMAVWLQSRGRESVIVSGDKDLLQLANDSISILRLSPMRNQPNQMYGPAEVEARYGVTPERLIDVFALMGDSIDNIPGVAGVGEKTAVDLIKQFQTLETLYENLDKIKGKKRLENLIAGRDNAFLSRELFILNSESPFELSDDFFKAAPIDERALYDFFNEMEFRGLSKEYQPEAETESPDELDYQTLDGIDALRAAVDEIKQAGLCAVDTETDSLDDLAARMVGLSLSIRPKQGWYIPFRHDLGKNMPLDDARPLLNEILQNESIQKIAHNFKFDLHILQNEGFEVRPVTGDTLIASYLAQPDRNTHKLDALVETFTPMRMTPITDLIGADKKAQKCMTEIEIERASSYACEDVDAVIRINPILMNKLDENGAARLYHEIEAPLVEVLAAMERRGVRVDPAILESQSNEIESEMAALQREIFDSVGREFNLNSPSQMAQILYDDLQLLSGRSRSTRADVLEKLAADGVGVAQKILDYRHRQKIKSTYLDALARLIRPETGRVHTSYNQAVVNTGRISSTDPNLQNIPIRTDLGRRVRRAFIAGEGFRLISLDYSQIELRVLAHMSGDPGLLSAFRADQDIHRRTASEIFNVAMEEVTPDMRRKAKEINFGLNYGMSPYGLARRIGVSDREAVEYIEAYFSRYPLVQGYMDRTVSFAEEHLYITTLMGRRVPTPGVKDPNRMQRDNARRAAINAPIQGSAADLLKKAMVDVGRHLAQNPDRAAALLTVHDELVLEAREAEAEAVAAECRELMEHAIELDIPTPVECSIGGDWASLK
ncbi:MAG: DNA polymerase I [bacterium]|nr:DNA polymerase I [bacterium]